jgi:F0F1-type ATP synthase delta subunit
VNNRNSFERKLKTDIHFKNTLRRELAQSLGQLHTWQEQLGSINNVRREKKLNSTVARYAGYVHELKLFLTPFLDDLEKRIKEEMSFSEEEIAQFKVEVESETKEAAEARMAFEKAKELLDSTEEKKKIDPEELKAVRETYRKAFKAFRLEKAELEHARKELESELVDREIFKRELKRIMIERHFMAQV